MRKTIIPNKLQTASHARVCKENKKNKKNDCPLKYFVVKGSTLEGCRKTATI